MNDLDEVLLIQQKNPIGGNPFWKLPGGQVDPDETLEQAVIREVKEETNVDAEVKGMLSFREVDGYMFGKHDLYFVYLMHAQKEQNELIAQEDEISKVEWVPCEEFVKRVPMLSPMLKRIVPIFNSDKEVCEKVLEQYRDEDSKQSMLKTLTMSSSHYEFRNRNNYLYLGKFVRDCMKISSKI